MPLYPHIPAGMSPGPHACRLIAIAGHTGECDRPIALYAAIVLERLTYWWKLGTRILKDGEWRAKPRDQLQRECILSRSKVDRALAYLKGLGFITTSQHKFGKGGLAVMHYRIEPKAVAAGAAPGVVHNVAGMPLEADPTKPGFLKVAKPIDMVGIGLSVTSTKVSNDTFSEVPESCVPPHASTAYGVQPEKISGKNLTETGAQPVNVQVTAHFEVVTMQSATPKKGGMSAAEMMAFKSANGAFPGTKPKKIDAKAPTGGKAMAEIYLDAWTKRYAGKYHSPLTAKQIGQLGMLRDKIEQVRPGKSELILRNVVANWLSFVSKAETDAGAFGSPEMPAIGMILKFATVALNLPIKEWTPVLPSAHLKAPEQAPAQLIAEGPAPKAHKAATLDEILAFTSNP